MQIDPERQADPKRLGDLELGPDGVVVVGGGMAGSLLALVLGRAGRPVGVIDLRKTPGPAFRNEKLGIDQIARITRLGVLSCFEQACWGGDEEDDDRGQVVPLSQRPALKDCGARYDRWLERIRAAWPANVQFIQGKVDRVEASDASQAVVLVDGRRIIARLAVLAAGRGERLLAGLGVARRALSPQHSICLGFSILPSSGEVWATPARIVHGRSGQHLAYVTVFPMLGEVRVNLFSYATLDNPWVRAMREDPLAVLAQTVPALGPLLTGAQIVRQVEVRSTDLYGVSGHVRAGVVLIGDAFHAPCPASGTGMTRILNDVERLAQIHIPQWMATPGMGRDKIAAFYADPIKRRTDRMSLRRSLNGRASVVSQALYWRLRRRLGGLKRRLIADPTVAAAGGLAVAIEPTPTELGRMAA